MPSAVALERAGLDADHAGREGRARARQRNAGDDRHRGARRAARGASRGRGRRHRRDVARGVSRQRPRLRSPPQRSAPASGTGARSRQPARAACRLRDRAVARGVRTRSRSVLVPLHSGRARRRPRLDRPRAPRDRDRGELGHRQPARLSRRTASFSRAATSTASRSRLRSTFSKFAVAELASIAERRLYLLLNAEDRGLPLFLTRRLGAGVGTDDRAVYRGGARQRQQRIGLAVERRFDPDLGGPRGSREHGHDLGQQSLARARQRGRRARLRTARRDGCHAIFGGRFARAAERRPPTTSRASRSHPGPTIALRRPTSPPRAS